MPDEYLTPAIEDRAVEIQVALADRGRHRAASIPDLLIAAPAGLAQLTVLHDDKDFELMADVTSQPIERINGSGKAFLRRARGVTGFHRLNSRLKLLFQADLPDL
jgi:hypothetical protein